MGDETAFKSVMSHVMSLVLSFLNEQFGHLDDGVLRASHSLYRSFISSKALGLSTFANQAVNIVIEHFTPLLQLYDFNAEAARDEWHDIKMDVSLHHQQVNNLPHLWFDYLQHRSDVFPNMAMLIEIVLVLPVFSDTCRRGHNFIKRAKSGWRVSLPIEELVTVMEIVINGPSVMTYDPSVAVHEWWEAMDEEDLTTEDLKRTRGQSSRARRRPRQTAVPV